MMMQQAAQPAQVRSPQLQPQPQPQSPQLQPQRPAAAGGQVIPQALRRSGSPGRRILFTLECVFSEMVQLHGCPRERRLIVHDLPSEDCCGPQFPSLSVGRVFQTELFDGLVVSDAARSTISREHFQMSIEGNPTACAFWLTNLSGNGTYVNDTHLQARGERAAVRGGDIITLARTATGPDGPFQVRFLEFRLDLTESFLQEGELSPRSSEGSESGRSSDGGLDQSFEGDVAFVFEINGPAVYDVPLDRRRIAYSPPPENDIDGLYSSLILGRAHQLGFWQEVLHQDAFNTLSREHFEVQTWRNVATKDGLHSSETFTFLVRNLSDVNPIHVRGCPESTMGEPSSLLARGEQRLLLDGDEIILNFDQEHTFWLTLRDLSNSTSIPVDRQARQLPGQVSGQARPPANMDLPMPTIGLGDTLSPADQWREPPNPFDLPPLLKPLATAPAQLKEEVGLSEGDAAAGHSLAGFFGRPSAATRGVQRSLSPSCGMPAPLIVRDFRGVREDSRRDEGMRLGAPPRHAWPGPPAASPNGGCGGFVGSPAGPWGQLKRPAVHEAGRMLSPARGW